MAAHSFKLPRERLHRIWNDPAADAAVRRLLAPILASQARAHADAQQRALIDTMLAKAHAEEWSRRQLVEKSGLTWGTFHRALTGALDPAVWLPRLRIAVAQLNTPLRSAA